MNPGTRAPRVAQIGFLPVAAIVTLCLTPPLVAHASVQAAGLLRLQASDPTLDIGEEIILRVGIENASNDGLIPLPATLTGVTTLTLACADSNCITQLQGTLKVTRLMSLNPGVAFCELDGSDLSHNTVNIVMSAAGVAVPASAGADLCDIYVSALVPISSPADGAFFAAANTLQDDLMACASGGTPCSTTSASVSTLLMFPVRCGDGIVNQPFETCDTNPLGGIPGTDQCCPAIRSDGSPNFCGTDPGAQVGCPANGQPCRSLASADPCTICGDGIVQIESFEECDDGNANDADACPNSCRLTPLTTITTSTTVTTTVPSSSTTSTSTSTTTTTSLRCGNGNVDPGEECDPGDPQFVGCCDSFDCSIKQGDVCGPDGRCGRPLCDFDGRCKNQLTYIGVICRDPGQLGYCDPGATCTESPGCPNGDIDSACTAASFKYSRSLGQLKLKCKAKQSDQSDPITCGTQVREGVVEGTGMAAVIGSGRTRRDVLEASDCTGATYAVTVSNKLRKRGREDLATRVINKIPKRYRKLIAPGTTICVRVVFDFGATQKVRNYAFTVP